MTAVTAAPPARGPAAVPGPFAGTGALARVWLRRDKVMIPSWLAAVTVTAYGSVAATAGLYGTQASRDEFARSAAGDGATTAMYGPPADLGHLGALATWKLSVYGPVLAAVLATLLVVRHTRAEEETGRLELVTAGVVGRRAPLTAAALVAALASLAMGLLTAAGLIGGGLPAGGSLAFGLGTAGTGLVFTGAAAVTAQLSATGRAANGLSLAVLAAAFLLRAAGDSAGGADGPAWPSWLSPIGWAQRVRPYGPCHWWLLVIPVAAAAALLAAAYRLAAGRDAGAGLWRPRAGRAGAAPSLSGTSALAWRLQRAALAAWAAAFAVYGAAVGGIAAGAGDLVGGNAAARRLFTELGGRQAITDAFLATILGFMAVLAAAYAVGALLRLRSEETGGRLEPLLAAPVTRVRWAAGHLAAVLAGTVVLAAVEGLATGLAHGLRGGDAGGQIPRVLGAALAALPAVWVLAGVTVFLYGLLPRYAGAAWGILGLSLLCGTLGDVLNLPRWVMDLSPFTHVPHLPGGAYSPWPSLWLTLAAAALTTAGLAGLRRRDLG